MRPVDPGQRVDIHSLPGARGARAAGQLDERGERPLPGGGRLHDRPLQAGQDAHSYWAESEGFAKDW